MSALFAKQLDALKEVDSRIWSISASPITDTMHFYHRVILDLLGKVPDDLLHAAIEKAQTRTEEEIVEKKNLDRDKEMAGAA